MADERKFELPRKIDAVLRLISKMYALDGERELQALVVNGKVRVVEETGYDNWNGGMYGHDLHLSVPEEAFVPLLKRKGDLQNKLRRDINEHNNIQNEYLENVFIELEENIGEDWRAASGLLISQGRQVSEHAERRIWGEGRFRVFLSHKTEVKIETSNLKEQLARYGASSFVAHEDIHPTQDWQNEIESALASSDAFIAILTEKFHESLWTDQEVGYALARGIPILALRFGRDPYGFIGKFQALSCTWDTAPLQIMKILIKQDRMVGAYVSAVAEVRNFDQANVLSELLPYIDKITQEGADLLVAAYNSNDEVRGGYGFNGRKPSFYGEGLVYHLKRLGFPGYEYDTSRRVTTSA